MKWVGRTGIAGAVLGVALGLAGIAVAQVSPTPAAAPTMSASPAMSPSPTMSPATSPSPSPTPSPSEPATLPNANPDVPIPDHSAAGTMLEMTPRPSATFEGKANRDEIYAAIMGSLNIIRSEIDKAGLKAAGRPIAVFLQADDEGFRYRAEIPLESAPAGKTELSPAVKIGLTPIGKAMKFEHRGAYDDIDATYEAITAYLDEKGIDAQDVFIEEYLNDVKTSDDPNLQVDIYVLLK
jgi:effector-binding domain-containing protein